jgi:hypothetical protein
MVEFYYVFDDATIIILALLSIKFGNANCVFFCYNCVFRQQEVQRQSKKVERDLE